MGDDFVQCRLPVAEDEPCGIDCLGDDRDSLNDLAKYFNNSHLSDVSIVLGDENFAAHRLILAKSSDVFDRMLSQRWNGESKELKIVEDPSCLRAFPAFLRFLYCNHVVLHHENALPVLILADKYNVASLKKVAVEFAVSSVIPHLDLKDIFHTWFSYATKVFHQKLIRACVDVIGQQMQEIVTSDEWEKTWLALDRDQMVEILKSNGLSVQNEMTLWHAVQRWLNAPSHSERRGPTASPLLSQVLPLVRYSFMSPDNIGAVESSVQAVAHGKLMQPLVSTAYKAHALSLYARAANKEYHSAQFLLRDYHDLRWDRRIVLKREQLERGLDHEFKVMTLSYTLPSQAWSWTLKLSTQGSFCSGAGEDALRVFLHAEAVDQPRCVEYLLSFVDDKRVIRSVVGNNQFTKSRYSTELDLGEFISIRDLASGSSPLLNGGELHLQISFKPPSGY